MIALLEGIVEEISPENSPPAAVLLCNGVGYHLLCSKRTCSHLKVGERLRLFVSSQTRDGELRLYGFFERAERDCFDLLIGVQGVGGKLALVVLSHFDSANLARAILSGDQKSLQGVSGLGTRTAQRLVVELEGKMSKPSIIASLEATAWRADETGEASTASDPLWRDLADALGALGFERSEITRTLETLRRIERPDSLDSALRQALKILRPAISGG